MHMKAHLPFVRANAWNGLHHFVGFTTEDLSADNYGILRHLKSRPELNGRIVEYVG